MPTLLVAAAHAKHTFLVQHYVEGGWGMHPILFLFLFTCYLIVERTRYLFTCRLDRQHFVATMRKHLMRGDVAGAIQACRAMGKPLSRIVEAGLSRLGRDDEEVQVAIDSVAMTEYPKIEKRTGYLAMLGNVATLMGLLGTITGLIRSFAAVGFGSKEAGGGGSKAEMLAAGISEAMNCTAFGLIVGIMALLAYSIMNGRTQNLLDEMNETVVHVMNLATGHRDAMKLDGVSKPTHQASA